MSYNNLYSVVNISKKVMELFVKPGMIVVDATMGNGNDTVKLAEMVGLTGKVFSFDIQQVAIDNTSLALKKMGFLDRVELILDGHENIDKYFSKEGFDLVIYNLGYLPRGNKNITTNLSTSLISIKKSLNLIKPNGFLIIVTYPGHFNGKNEDMGINKFLETLNQKEFNVLKTRFINQANNPPILYLIEKSNSNCL